jgi:pre-mRNA-splicing factor SYF1
MLRIKRSVLAQYNTDIGYVNAQAQAGAAIETNGAIDDGDPMASLERTAPLSGFVESTTGPVGGGAAKDEMKDTPVDTPMENPDAIELGEDDDDSMQED